MATALDRALEDTGAPALAGALDLVVVPQGTWRLADPARTVAAGLGLPPVRTVLGQVGVSQQVLCNRALSDVAAGRSAVAVVLGGEARAYERTHPPADPDPAAPGPDEVLARDPDFLHPAEHRAGLVVPVQQYALIEQARRLALGRTPAEHRAEVAAMWARFNRVARDNPRAAFGAPRDARAIECPGPDNRPLSLPYNKWHASQWTVDQAAALVVTTLGRARQAGVAPDRLVFPLAALTADHAVTLSARAGLHRWPAMGVLARAAEDHLGRPLSSVPLAEVYSCFPSAVAVQMDELGLDPGSTPTLTGGMAFAGGPFNNFVLQATVEVAGRLRAEPGATGLVTTVCGLLTTPGLALWQAGSPGDLPPPLVADLAPAAAAATPTRPVDADYAGPATVASYTVTYDRAGDPARLVVVGDTPEGGRAVGAVEDPVPAARALEEDLGRAPVGIERGRLIL
jgi:acetyl-CoA C-acetyltransferase